MGILPPPNRNGKAPNIAGLRRMFVVDFFPRKFWGLNIICRIPLFSKRIHLFDVIVAKIMAPCPPTKKKKNIWRQSLEEMEKWPYLCLAKGNIQQASASRR